MRKLFPQGSEMITISQRFLSSIILYVFVSSAFAFTPTQQQIEQFKNMPKAQQQALAKQLGVNLSDFQLDDSGKTNKITEDEIQVEREVDWQEIADELSKQSSAKELSKELKPFGYELFEQAETTFTPSSNTPVPADYKMGPGDTINLQLFGKETGQYELTINNEGEIQLPDLGTVPAIGLTYEELKLLLIDKYKQQVIGVTPHITMGTLRTIQVFFVGEAFRPGALVVNSLATITHALFASGGVNNIGSLRNIELKRAGKTVEVFDLYDLLIFGSTEHDVRLQQGDVIFIPAVKKLVSVDGNVRRPAIYEIKQGESLNKLLDIAGGLLPNAAQSLQIARRSPGEELEVKTVLVDDKSTKQFDLLNGDYINVPDANNEFSNAIVVSGAHASPGLVQWREGLKISSIVKNNLLLNSTDLEYALIIRREKFARQSEVIQFSPLTVLDGELDFELNRYDQITLFNRNNFDKDDDQQKEATDVDLKQTMNDLKAPANNLNISSGGLNALTEDLQTSENDLKSEHEDYLKALEGASFTEKQLLLSQTKNYSRKKLLAPIIARLKNEGTFEYPIKLAEITGQVKFPGVYPIASNGRVKDLIIAGGGLVESAYTTKAELSRTKVSDESRFQVQHIELNLFDVLTDKPDANQKLVSKDTLNIHRIPDWYDNRKVELVGEVVFPGIYQIKKNETLAQLLQRAGGFTTEASVRAAIFTREELKERERKNLDKTVEDLRQQIISSNVSGSQTVKTVNYEEASLILDELLSVEPVGRLVIDLPEILKGKVNADIPLKDGDKLYVPNISASVSVIGEVFVPTTHRLEESVSLQDYINRSGGFTERADKNKIYVVKANGSVKVPNQDFWFGGEKVTLEAGDTIVVPRDIVNYERLGLWQTVTQIVYQSIVSIAAIARL